MITLTRRYEFPASHRLYSKQLSDADNDRIYGKCNNPYGHGHNYVVDVSVRGPVDARTGLAVNLAELDRYVRERVVEPFGHRNLNEDVDDFNALVPTTENLGVVVERRLREAWPWSEPRLEKIRIAETDRNIFEIVSHETERQ